MDLVKIIGTALCVTLLSACGGGGGSDSSAPTNISSGGSGTATKVTLSGQVTFDKVPHKEQGFGLNYDATIKAPSRGVVVVLLDENNGTVAQTITDGTGNYSFSNIAASKDVKVQARAQLKRNNDWNVKVTDNTLDNALYVMEGSLNSTGTNAAQTRDLHAGSGWNGSRYGSNRVAGPFAILDPVYDAVQMVRDVDPEAIFPSLEYRWSPDNQPVAGNKVLGQIGTSGYHREDNAVYLLGAADRDTDEYDPHVIVHEWGHYFEHHIARMDSMGGLHSLSDKLDPRLAFSEGFGNGLAAIITGDPEYKDSSGAGQGTGFGIDFENLNSNRAGWFNEGSVAAILYDIHDDAVDGNDRVAAGFAPIYGAMTSGGFKEADVFGTVFSFSDALASQDGINLSDYRILLETQNISSSDAQGAGERNNGAIASSLPVYKEAVIGAGPVTICSVDDAGRFNKLGNREFVYVDIAQSGRYEIAMVQSTGEGSRDPDFNIWSAGSEFAKAQSSRAGSEIYSDTLEVGSYVIEGFDFYNINGNSDRAGDACFELSITSI